MPVRFYLAPYENVGDVFPGRSGNPYHSRCFRHTYPIDPSIRVSAKHGRPWKDWCICRVDGPDAAHTAIQADAQITLIPLWDSGNNYLTLDDSAASITAANRTAMVNFLENRNIPTGWIIGTMTIRQVFRWIIRLLVIIQVLKDDYPNISLDSTVGDIPADQQNRMMNWMDNNGIARSDFTLATPIRTVLRRIIDQYGWFSLARLGVII